jgi:hypothetical protein
MKNFISLALCSLFLAQVASAAEQQRTQYERIMRAAPYAGATMILDRFSLRNLHLMEQYDEINRQHYAKTQTNIFGRKLKNENTKYAKHNERGARILFLTTPIAFCLTIYCGISTVTQYMYA